MISSVFTSKYLLIIWGLCSYLCSSITNANTAHPGGIYSVPISGNIKSAHYQGNQVLIVNGMALVGLALSTSPGPHELKFVDSNGNLSTHFFVVRSKKYSEQHITFKTKSLVNPAKSSLERIKIETEKMKKGYLTFTPSDTQNLAPFNQPVEGKISSLFGHRRILNGQPRSPHSGLDIAAPIGTKIASPAPATVILTGNFYFNGKTVFLDHGQGLITMYCHLDQIKVEVGEKIKRNQIIGLVGETGRATGPHLHWSVSLNGNRVDPLKIIEILGPSA